MLTDKTIGYINGHCGSLSGKTIVVTGANSGIGYKATEELVFLGARVIMACRSIPKAQTARESLLKDHPEAHIEIRHLDLAGKTSIEAFADGLIKDNIDIDAFVSNAGIFRIQGRTEDGEDIVMGTNFTGTIYIVERLLPYLESLPHKVKITFTTSISYVLGERSLTEDYSKMSALRLYATSKLRLTRYALNLDESLKGSNVEVILTHPGISITPIADKAFSKTFMKIAHPLGRLLIQSPEKSALAVPYVLSNDVESGNIYGPNGFLCGWGYPERNRRKAILTHLKPQ